jgi:S1-C subfamily serine protease
MRAAIALLIVLPFVGCKKSTPSPDATVLPGQSASVSPAPVPPPSPGARIEDEKNTIGVFRAVAPSTVYVTQTRVVLDYFGGVAHEVPAGSGSGFIWDEQGHVVTNFHVVDGARSLTVTFHDQQTFEAKVVGLEPRKDVAVLKVDAPKSLLVPIRVAKGTELEVGRRRSRSAIRSDSTSRSPRASSARSDVRCRAPAA